MYDTLEKLIVLHEGRVAHAYQDSLGYWTIGVGHLIDARKGGSLPPHIIDLLLAWDIAQSKQTLLTYHPWVAKLDPVRQAVLFDMCHNLGPEPFDGDGFKDWPIFLGQVRDGKYREAAANMRSTLWAKQVKTRAERLAKMMETGQWPSA